MASGDETEISVVIDFLYAVSSTMLCENISDPSSGGLESLFSNQKQIKLALPIKDETGQPVNMDFLIRHLSQNHLKGRKDFFVLEEVVSVILLLSTSQIRICINKV